MKYRVYKVIAIIFYCLITLKGMIIGIPFIFWLLYSVFDFGNLDQVFALFAIIGLVLSFLKKEEKKERIRLEILAFFLLLSPIISKISVIPIQEFNYLSFIIPTLIFILFYIFFIGFQFLKDVE